MGGPWLARVMWHAAVYSLVTEMGNNEPSDRPRVSPATTPSEYWMMEGARERLVGKSWDPVEGASGNG